MIMSHRINQTSNALHLKPLMEKFYFYWGLAVRSLNDYLNMEDKRAGNTIIAGILTLLLADVSHFYPRILKAIRCAYVTISCIDPPREVA